METICIICQTQNSSAQFLMCFELMCKIFGMRGGGRTNPKDERRITLHSELTTKPCRLFDFLLIYLLLDIFPASLMCKVRSHCRHITCGDVLWRLCVSVRERAQVCHFSAKLYGLPNPKQSCTISHVHRDDMEVLWNEKWGEQIQRHERKNIMLSIYYKDLPFGPLFIFLWLTLNRRHLQKGFARLHIFKTH